MKQDAPATPGGSDKYERAAMFPAYTRDSGPDRTLALYEAKTKRITTEHGEVLPTGSYEALVSHMFESNLLVYVHKISLLPFIGDMIDDHAATCICDKKGRLSCVRVKRGKQTRWVVQLASWDLPPEPASLPKLRQMFDYMGVGTSNTPGALGFAKMLSVWKKARLGRHTVCNGFGQRFIKATMSGGRVDTPALGHTAPYMRVIELDRTSSYLAEFKKPQPCGTTVRFGNGRVDKFTTYYGNVIITILEKLPLGPFPVRQSKNGKEWIEYPTEPGQYFAVLWKEQVEICRAAGCDVQVLDGYGWKEMTEDNAVWCDTMYDLKIHAPDDFTETSIKKSIVAGIGRHGMSDSIYRLVPESLAEYEDVPFVDNGEMYTWYIHENTDFFSVSMVHWFAYTIMLAAVELYKFALPYAADGRLLATNYDSCIVIPSPGDMEKYPSRADSRELTPGTWRWEVLTNVWIVAPRSVVCDQKAILPGIDADMRQEYIAGLYARRAS